VQNIPYLNYIRSFEAAARYLSFTAAAEELNYTQSAISHHVRSLEQFIGQRLFNRTSRSLTLTPLGTAYLNSVRQALRDIDDATEEIITNQHDRKVTISCPVSLAQNWLTRVITKFNAEHPDITICILGEIWPDDDDHAADIKLINARTEAAPPDSEKLWSESLAVVCAPAYVTDRGPLREPADLCHARLIHVLGRTAYWQQLADRFGLTNWTMASRTQTNSLNVALELAIGGQGCAILPRSVVTTHLERGLLAEPVEVALTSPWACYMLRGNPVVSRQTERVMDWLRIAAQQEAPA
jgi:LysR family glycine cleavage system transcriptional activator